MSQPTTEVISKEQAQHIERIKEFHGKFLESFGDQMGYAFLTGMAATSLKESCAHGEFEKLKKDFLADVPRSSLGNYMGFYKGMLDKYPTVGHLIPKAGRFEGEQRVKLLEAVKEVADGKTLTAMYRDTGAIRHKLAKENHPAVEMSPEEKLQAETDQAESLVSGLCGDIHLMLEGEALAKVAPGSRKALLDAATQLTKKLRQFKKSKGAKQPAKGAKQ